VRVKIENETRFSSVWLREMTQAGLHRYVSRAGVFRVRIKRARTQNTLRYGRGGFVLMLHPEATQRSALWLIHLGVQYAGGASIEGLRQQHAAHRDEPPPTWVPDLTRLPLVPTNLPVPLEELGPKPVEAYIARQDKLLHARMMLARAETRAKRAETLRKKWAQKVKRLERQAARTEGLSQETGGCEHGL
jgi:hypothetical protein